MEGGSCVLRCPLRVTSVNVGPIGSVPRPRPQPPGPEATVVSDYFPASSSSIDMLQSRPRIRHRAKLATEDEEFVRFLSSIPIKSSTKSLSVDTAERQFRVLENKVVFKRYRTYLLRLCDWLRPKS